jgi:hypothetical protein
MGSSDMKRAVEVEAPVDARTALRAAIVEKPRAVREERRLERTVIMIALVRNCIVVGRIWSIISSSNIKKYNEE